jgi:Tol biopolymer transport system component
MSRLRYLLLGAALLIVGCGTSSGAATQSSLIVFSADRAPIVSGEVYRLDPNGHRVDLSKSLYPDLFPAVSSNGKKVAFVRDLGAAGSRIYEVGITGHGLVRFAPKLPRLGEVGCDPGLAWQPASDRLAAGVCGGRGSKLWILQPHRQPIVLAAGLSPSWSPDGRVLVGSTPSPTGASVVHAFSPTGSALWQAPGKSYLSSWSSTNLLAVPSNTGLAVYDESGHRMLKESGRVSAAPAWSPNGQLLALIIGDRLEVRTPSGEGVLYYKRLPGADGLTWNGNDHVIIGGFRYMKSLDVHTGKLTSATGNWFAPRSPNGKLAIITPKSGNGYTINVAPAAGGSGKTYTHVPQGYDDGPVVPIRNLQFVGSRRSVVYASYNPEPFLNLYTVAPSGGAAHQLTGVKPYASQPQFSPDGSKIAYSWAQFTGMTCKGCALQIRVADADGTGMRILTTPQDCTFDNSPTWSPDGTKIMYSETGCDNPGELFTVPAAGGTPDDLHLAGTSPAWGSSKIAYQGALNSSGGIWTANPDGSSPTKVSASGHTPAWSATGTLAYLTGAATVKVGSNSVHLPFASVSSFTWSPDGTHFVVVARKTKTAFPDVYTVKVDGTNPVRLTTNYNAGSATWR